MSSQQEFWHWFTKKEDELFNFENDRETVFDKIAEQLQKIDPDLSFEIGPKIDGKREFIISASGIKRAFPAVSGLTAVAPNFQRWEITAFRPRRAVMNIVEFRGKRVHPNEVQFSLLHNGKTIGIYLFVPGFSEEDGAMKQIGYLILDEALGEFDVESKIGLIKMFPPEVNVKGERYPLLELPCRFDELLLQLKPK